MGNAISTFIEHLIKIPRSVCADLATLSMILFVINKGVSGHQRGRARCSLELRAVLFIPGYIVRPIGRGLDESPFQAKRIIQYLALHKLYRLSKNGIFSELLCFMWEGGATLPTPPTTSPYHFPPATAQPLGPPSGNPGCRPNCKCQTSVVCLTFQVLVIQN